MKRLQIIVQVGVCGGETDKQHFIQLSSESSEQILERATQALADMAEVIIDDEGDDDE